MPDIFDELHAADPFEQARKEMAGTQLKGRVAKLRSRFNELEADPNRAANHVYTYWTDAAKLARQSIYKDDEASGAPLDLTVHKLMQTAPAAERERIRDARLAEWREMGPEANQTEVVSEFLDQRKQVGSAAFKNYLRDNPDASSQQALAHMHELLDTHGFQLPGIEQMPPLVPNADGELEYEYTPVWTELKSVVSGIASGVYKMTTGPKAVGTMIGEAATDLLGAEDGEGAPLAVVNEYRETRKRMGVRENEVMKAVGLGRERIPYMPEGFNLFQVVGEQVPQFAVTAGAAKAVSAGLVSKFVGRSAAAAAMFAIETPQAYKQYLEFAAEQGMRPEDASQVAAAGALTYGVVSGILESYGPFEVLSRFQGKKFGRMATAAIVSLTEGGTEFSQAMTQAAIAQGLDLKGVDWDSLRGAMQEALAGMIVGGAASAATYQAPPDASGGHTIDPGDIGAVSSLDQLVSRGGRESDIRREIREFLGSEAFGMRPETVTPSRLQTSLEAAIEAETGRLIAEDPRDTLTPSEAAELAVQARARVLEAGRGPTVSDSETENIKLQAEQPRTTLQTTTELSSQAVKAVAKIGPISLTAPGVTATVPAATYESGSKNLQRPNRNVWVRQSEDKANDKRVLLVQWSSDLLQKGERGTPQDQYGDKLFTEREGYVRADDFWELPQWVGAAANNLPNSDLYVIRDIDEAIAFFNEAGYDEVAFSVLDVNKALVEQVAKSYEGKVVVGGYADLGSLEAVPNVTKHAGLSDWVKARGVKSFKEGTDYRHFDGTKIQPRLTMSEGCLHGCTFCAVKPRKSLCVLSPSAIAAQLKSFADLDYDLVYINDKTFGQAKNHTALVEAYKTLKKQNPNFRGFIVQTSAAQLSKMSPEFLKKAGIKYVEIGVESYNDAILRENRKPANRKLIDGNVKKLREAGIAMIPNVLIGLPSETAVTYGNTLDFLRRNQDIISHINAYNLALYAGTELTGAVESVADADLDENQVTKSFHKNPKIHEDFNRAVFKLGLELLDNPAIGLPPLPEVTVFEGFADQVVDQPSPDTEDIDPAQAVPDGTPERSVLEGITNLYTDQVGAIDVNRMGHLAAGGFRGAVAEVGLLGSAAHAIVSDISAPLQKTRQGLFALSVVDEAEARHLRLRSPFVMQFDDALRSMPGSQRRQVLRWMFALREDGQTNWATLIEHPDRVTAKPRGVERVEAAYRDMQRGTGAAATAAKVPQLQRVVDKDGEVEFKRRAFKGAKGGRYFRRYTADGLALMKHQKGHYLWDSLVKWLRDNPERNPNLDTADETALRNQLAGEIQSGKTRKAGSLEFVRIFDELPVALRNRDGKWVEIQIRDPKAHYRASIEGQSRRIALWSTMTDFLLPRYGKYSEKTGKVEYRLRGGSADLVDVDGMVDRLRKEVASSFPTKPEQAETWFNRLLETYQRDHFGGWAEEYFTDLGDSVLGKLATAVDRTLVSSMLTLAPLYDVGNPIRSAGVVGWQKMLRGYGSALVDMLRHPRQFAAEYRAMGAVIDSHADWTVHRDTWMSDVFGKNIPQALMTVGRWSEERSQFAIARMHDLWVQSLNDRRALTPADARLLEKHLRLTPDQIAEIGRGEMSQATRAKVLQAAVKSVAGLTESAFRKGVVQNHPMGRTMFRFLSVVNSVTRAGVRHAGDITEDVAALTSKKATKAQRVVAMNKLMRSAWSMLSFVAAIAGNGFLQDRLRRVVSGKPQVDADDPDTWAAALANALAEGGVFGPYYRIFEAAKYSGGDLSRMATQLVLPLGIIVEVSSALLGYGVYSKAPYGRRLETLGKRYSPVWRAFDGWRGKLMYPGRQPYRQTRKLVRQYHKDKGVSWQPGTGARDWRYYAVFEAIRDQDEARLATALRTYKKWAKAQGLDQEDARRRLQSSLNSRRPINLKPGNRKEFLAGLSERRRKAALQTDEAFTRTLDRILARPGVPRKPRKPEVAQAVKPTKGNWLEVD